MTISCDISVGCDALPLTLWAGVGRVVAVDGAELFMLDVRSEVAGEN